MSGSDRSSTSASASTGSELPLDDIVPPPVFINESLESQNNSGLNPLNHLGIGSRKDDGGSSFRKNEESSKLYQKIEGAKLTNGEPLLVQNAKEDIKDAKHLSGSSATEKTKIVYIKRIGKAENRDMQRVITRELLEGSELPNSPGVKTQILNTLAKESSAAASTPIEREIKIKVKDRQEMYDENTRPNVEEKKSSSGSLQLFEVYTLPKEPAVAVKIPESNQNLEKNALNAGNSGQTADSLSSTVADIPLLPSASPEFLEDRTPSKSSDFRNGRTASESPFDANDSWKEATINMNAALESVSTGVQSYSTALRKDQAKIIYNNRTLSKLVWNEC